MFGLLRTKKDKGNKIPDFVEAKSFFGMSIHVYDNKEHKVLCGYEKPVITKIEITPEAMVSTINKQHAGFMWCQDCGSSFTNKSSEDFINGRNSR